VRTGIGRDRDTGSRNVVGQSAISAFISHRRACSRKQPVERYERQSSRPQLRAEELAECSGLPNERTRAARERNRRCAHTINLRPAGEPGLLQLRRSELSRIGDRLHDSDWKSGTRHYGERWRSRRTVRAAPTSSVISAWKQAGDSSAEHPSCPRNLSPRKSSGRPNRSDANRAWNRR
jgi:hypothetical protein